VNRMMALVMFFNWKNLLIRFLLCLIFQSYKMELIPITGGILGAMDKNKIELKGIKIHAQKLSDK
jgi:hypothetical protein